MKECSFHNSICQCPTDFLLFEAHLSPFRLTLSIALGQDHLGLQEEWWQCGWEETSGKRLVCKAYCLREWKPPNLSVMYQCCEVPTSTKHWHRPGVIWPGAILNVYHLFFFHCMHVTWCEHLSQPLALCQRTFTPPLLYPANFTVLAKQLFFFLFLSFDFTCFMNYVILFCAVDYSLKNNTMAAVVMQLSHSLSINILW